MIKVFYSIGDAGEVLEKELTSEATFESWCTRMDDEHGYGGWDINHTEYA